MAYPPFAYMEPAIAQGESGGDWNALYNFQNRAGGLFGDTRVSDMTINEVLDFQRTGSPYATYVTDILGYKSTPVGRYQIVGDTLEWAKGKLGLTGEEKFDPATQRQIAEYIYNTQGPSAWEALKGTQMADQVTPQQMAPQQAAGYQPFSTENLPRNQRILLGISALQDAAASLRGKQTSFFSEALGGLEQQHRYGQELAFRQGQEQRLIDERAAAASQSAVASQLRAAEALAQVRQQLQWSPNDPTLLALEQSLMAQALGPSGVMPATAAPAGAPAGVVPAAGAEPAAQPVSLPTAVTYANDPSKLDDAQLSAAMATLSTSNDPKAVEALKVLRGEAATRAEAQEKSGPDIENYRSAQTLITEISSNPALSGVLGRFEGGIEAGMYFSEKENALLAQIEQIRGKAFLDAFEKLKGGGPITDTEGRAATNAVTRIQNRFTDVAEYKKALEELRQVFANAEARATNKPVPYPNIGAANAQNPAGVSQEAFEFFSVSPEGQ